MIKTFAAICGLMLLTATACGDAKIEVTTDKDENLTITKDGKKIEVDSMKVNLNAKGVQVEVKDKQGKTQVLVDEKAKKQ